MLGEATARSYLLGQTPVAGAGLGSKDPLQQPTGDGRGGLLAVG